MRIMDRNDRRLELRKFEYDTLHQRVLADSRASYSLMAAVVALSEAIFAASLTNLQNLGINARIGAALASLAALVFWYPVDRRFVWAERRRLARMERIETEVGILNQRIFSNEEDIFDSGISDKLGEIDSESGAYAHVAIHQLYLGLIAFMTIAWILVVLS